jgi:hypothetical protein
LELEILETGTLKNIDHMSQLMRKCTALGVDFALDDFGTGHSSLTYLRRLPTQLLKIDHSFIRNMLQDPDDLAILEGILGMAQAFRRPILAEGIETVAHGKMLLQMGCTLGQGHAIAMPMPADALPDWLHTWQAPTVWRDCPPVGRDKRVLLYAMTEIRAYVCALYRYLHAIPDHTASEHDLQTYQFSQWSYLNHPTRTWQLITPAQIHALHAHLHDSSTHLLALHEQGQCMQAQQGFHKVAHARDALLAELERELTHPGPAAPALTLA